VKKSALVFMTAGLLAVAAWALSADVTGDWDLTSQSPRGERTSTVTFKQDGENLTVTMPPMREGGEAMTGTGTVKGNAIEWTITRTTQRGEFTMTYKGTIDGDTMKGTVEMGQMGAQDWTAKKKA
jgi:hypothetical protein